MSFALAIAVLSSVLTASCILIAQGIQSQRKDRRLQAQQLAAQHIQHLGRMVAPRDLAEQMQISELKAHRLLCSMVDDYYFTLQFNRIEGLFQFGFTEKYREKRIEQAFSDASPPR